MAHSDIYLYVYIMVFRFVIIFQPISLGFSILISTWVQTRVYYGIPYSFFLYTVKKPVNIKPIKCIKLYDKEMQAIHEN